MLTKYSFFLRSIFGFPQRFAVRTRAELAERFGEQLGVVSSIAPNKQEGTWAARASSQAVFSLTQHIGSTKRSYFRTIHQTLIFSPKRSFFGLK